MPSGERFDQLLTSVERDHGGGVDAAVAAFGGNRIDWIDLSTGINPVAYPIPNISNDAWTNLPDTLAMNKLLDAARDFWKVPDTAGIVCAAGASALISRIPTLMKIGSVTIPGPTYNEHAAAFEAQGWQVSEMHQTNAQAIVHPNNPDGKLWRVSGFPVPSAQLTVIDESFCDVCPEESFMPHANNPGSIILKSFGKFWGLAGLRLGFAIGEPQLIAKLKAALGPWPVAGPALEIGAAALTDQDWAAKTRERLAADSDRLDALLEQAGAETVGGTSLFRLYRVENGANWQDRLARHQIWSRTFPYDASWLRLGIPHPDDWSRLEAALV